MDQKWIHILAILVFCLKITSGAGEDKATPEGQLVEIHCQPKTTGSMIVWFRVLDKTGMEFIGSFSNTGIVKSSPLSPIFSFSKIIQKILILQSFNKSRDSGIYSCASLYKGNELSFGKVTRLFGEKAPQGALVPTSKPTLCTTAAIPPCVCNKKKEEKTNPDMYCPLIILGPLAGGCGLLLLLLIITTLYCNKIRTRRCPHHYKRKPQTMAPGKQMMTNRHAS
ncbi:T-cell surface glycoprotein CD8 alpha chain [Morone saxatilis]|uniref:T-cell surface glycoprotein CD8 alpha chain n=1 Tax=Morone saxatilis TaxID=34816 RepID=UPI0015E1DEDB|nr:T-cell surface glycoprotein CD8 alpha chain [Morone saxatilis]